MKSQRIGNPSLVAKLVTRLDAVTGEVSGSGLKIYRCRDKKENITNVSKQEKDLWQRLENITYLGIPFHSLLTEELEEENEMSLASDDHGNSDSAYNKNKGVIEIENGMNDEEAQVEEVGKVAGIIEEIVASFFASWKTCFTVIVIVIVGIIALVLCNY